MGFVRHAAAGSSIDEAFLYLPKNNATAFAAGDCISIDRSANELIAATSSHDNHGADALLGICTITAASTDTHCSVVPFQQNQLWEIGTANNTASTQLLERCVLTDKDTLNNTGTDDTSAKAIFEIVKILGDASDKKVVVRIVSPAGQVTA